MRWCYLILVEKRKMRFTRLTQWKSDVYIKISVHYRYLKFVQHFNVQLSPLTQRTYPSLALSWGVLRNLQCQGGRCNSMRRGKSIGLHYIPCFIISVDCPFVFLGGFWRFFAQPWWQINLPKGWDVAGRCLFASYHLMIVSKFPSDCAMATVWEQKLYPVQGMQLALHL